MANEITTNQATGLTLTARLVLAGAFVGAVITLTESSTVSGHYTGSPPGGTAANVYTVLVFNGATRIADGLLRWDGANEVLSASQASVAAIPTTPLLAGSYTAPDNASILDIKAKTVALPADPSSQSGTVLADVRKINNIAVTGAGITGNAWRPA